MYRLLRSGVWSRPARRLAVDVGDGTDLISGGYLALREVGIVVQRGWVDGLSLRFETLHTFSWAMTRSVELTPRRALMGRKRWAKVLFSGSGFRIGLTISVGADFLDSLETLGASSNFSAD